MNCRRTLLALVLTASTACRNVEGPRALVSQLTGPSGEAHWLTDAQAADVQLALGRTFEQQGEFDSAISAYLAAVRRNPKRAEPYLRLAILSDLQGNFAQAARYYQRALQMDPGNAEIFSDRGYSLYLQRQWSEAEMNLKQSLALDPELPRAHNNLGVVLAHTGRFDAAVVEFQNGGSSEPESHVAVAAIATLNRRWDEARKHYELALALEPLSQDAQAGLSQLAQLAPETLAEEPHPAQERALIIPTAFSQDLPSADPAPPHSAFHVPDVSLFPSDGAFSSSTVFSSLCSAVRSNDAQAGLLEFPASGTSALAEIAISLAKLGDLQEALIAAAEISKAHPDAQGALEHVRALAGIAVVYAALNNQETADTLLDDSLRFAAAIRPMNERFRVLGTIATAQAVVGNLAEALSTAGQLPDRTWHRDMALLQVVVATAAIGNLEEALNVARKIDAPLPRGEGLANVSLAYAQRDNLERALDIAREIGGDSLLAGLLSRIAITEARRGRRASTESLIIRSEDLLNAAPADFMKVTALLAAQTARRELGDASSSSLQLQQAITVAERLDEDSIDRPRAFWEIAAAQARSGHPEEALATANRLPTRHRDGALERVAEAQAARGNWDAALQTVREIRSEGWRAYTIQTLARLGSDENLPELLLAWAADEDSPLVRACTFLGIAETLLNRPMDAGSVE